MPASAPPVAARRAAAPARRSSGAVGDRQQLAHQRPLRASRSSGRRGSLAQQLAVACPRATTRPSSTKTTRSAWSSTSGLVVTMTVVLPGARLAQPLRDPRLGVRVDRARRLDEHEQLGVREQRAREHEPLALAAGERAAALVDRRRRAHPAAPRCTSSRVRDRDRASGSPSSSPPRPHGSSAVRSVPGEEDGVGLADDDPPAHRLDRQLREPHAAERRRRRRRRTAEPVGERRRLLGRRGDEARQQARLDDEPGLRRRRAARRGRLGDRGAPARAIVALDARARRASAGRRRARGDLVDGLGRGAQRDDEEGRVPVERDQLADVDPPREREARAEPGDEHDEEPGNEAPGPRRASTAGARPARRCAAPPAIARGSGGRTPARRRSRAARAARGGVGAERSQLADLLALLELPRLERLDDVPSRRTSTGTPTRTTRPSDDGRRQQDERNDEVRRRSRRPAGR